MILAGGLGSSAYVRDAMQKQMIVQTHRSAQRLVVVPCTEPQLVVVKGLLMDRQQRMQTGSKPILSKRIARASYGVVTKHPYDAQTHHAEDWEYDEHDTKKKWATKQIEWLIRKVKTK